MSALSDLSSGLECGDIGYLLANTYVSIRERLSDILLDMKSFLSRGQ